MKVFLQHDAVAALSSGSLAVVPFRKRYDALSLRLGVDFGAVTAALDGIPLCLRDDAHEAQRTLVAKLIAERRALVLDAMPGIVDERFDRLRRVGPCDVMGEIVLPCVDQVLSVLTGLPAGVEPDALVSRVFSQTMGVAKRRRLNAEIAGWRSRIAEAFPDDDAGRQDARLSLLILGRDALIGTVALSLRSHFQDLGDEPLSSARMPATPTHTGVPYVDRDALGDSEIGGCRVGAGETVRVALDGFQGMSDAWRMRFFGAGRHVCLGRPMSLDLMERVSAALAGIDTRVVIAEFAMRKDDVFAVPGTFRIEIRE